MTGTGQPAIVAATANPAKLEELRLALARTGLELTLTARPADLGDVVEDADSLAGNARLKAEAVRAHTGETAMADDTGLFVDVLGGRPGVHSARFAGPDATDADNVALLLAEMDRAGRPNRAARFRTVLVVATADGRELVVEGVTEGTIAHTARGTNGFGYDPVFVPAGGGGATYAELPAAEKDRIGHRGRAVRALAGQLGAFLDGGGN
ncbi:MAG: RdgB/HAM1 family non-canonical purine NTP pyrophosphatase [Acidimicrobiales bacterium]